MIRWKFVLTRLLIVVAVLTLIRWGLGPAAKYLTIRSLQMATGAKVEIARAEIGLFPPRVYYGGVRVADPRGRKAFRDLFRAESIDFEIDGDALLRRRWVVRQGRISGLEIGAARDDSGHFEREPVPAPEPAGPSYLSRLIGGAMDGLGDRAEAFVDDLETARRAAEIRRRWEADYEELAARARALERQVREIRDEAQSIKNPLRDYVALDRTIAQANRTRTDLLGVRNTIDAIPGRVRQDLDSLDEAKQIDLAKVEGYVPENLRGSGGFAKDLMSQVVRERLGQVREYLDQGRSIANATVVPPARPRERGQTIDMSGGQRPPRFLVRRCELDGLVRSGGRVYTVRGVVDRLTPSPHRLDEPTRARLLLEDTSLVSEPIRLDYVRDRRNGGDIDRISMHWPRSDARPTDWGRDDRVGISISGGRRELWAQYVRDGEAIRGRLVSKHTDLEMQLRVAPDLARSGIAGQISSRLAEVDRIEIDAEFAGTWKDLDLKFESNLERILREATEEAIASEIASRREQVAAKVRHQHAKQAAELERWIEKQQSEARSLVAAADASIDEMFQKVTRGVGSADAYLGRLKSSLPKALR